MTHFVSSLILPCQDRFNYAIDIALETINAFQPKLDTSKTEQVDVLEELGKVSTVKNINATQHK